MLEREQCALCGGVGIELETARYAHCPRCGTLSQYPPGPGASPGLLDYAREPGAVDIRWVTLLSGLTEGRRLMDIGCGSGAFLAAAGEAGWQADGIDSDPRLVGIAAGAGRRAVAVDVDDWVPAADGYDVVSVWFVLEHVRHPGRLLRRAIGALRRGGLLLIAVPNDAGWLSRRVMRTPDDRFWEHPLHLHHYPPFGLERWLEVEGLALEVAEAGRPTELMRGGVLPLYECWEAARQVAPALSRLFYQLGVGRSREMIWRVPHCGDLERDSEAQPSESPDTAW